VRFQVSKKGMGSMKRLSCLLTCLASTLMPRGGISKRLKHWPDLRQEIAADIEAERSAEEEQAFDYELALGDNDQDSGLDPEYERQQERQEYEPEPQPLESAVGADFGGDSDS
jgi:hypothetical protein